MTVEFSTDPQRVAALRAEGEARRPKDALERFFLELPESYSLGEADRKMLRERRGEATPRLLEIAARDMATTNAGAVAILALCVLKEPDVLPIAREALRDGKATWRHVVMSEEAAFLGTDAEIRRMLLARLDSPDSEEAETAVQECGILKLPGAVERFAELIRRPDAPDRPRMAFWIGKFGPTPERVTAIEAAWFEGPTGEDEEYWFLVGLGEAACEGPPEARRAAVAVLLRWLREIRDGVRPRRGSPGSFDVDQALDALRRAAPEEPRCVTAAVDLLRAPNPPFQNIEKHALDVIAAGDPPLHRSMALEVLRQPDAGPVRRAVESLGKAYEGSGDAEVVAAILAARERQGVDEMLDEVVDEALARIGGAEAVAAVEAGLGDSPSVSRMRVLWRTRKLDPQKALERMAALGGLRDADGLAELARGRLREAWPDREPEPADVFLDALAAAGVAVGFDVEADVVPPRHDELILRLAEETQGAFVVEAARQTWNLPPGVSEDDVDDETAEGSRYVVEFLHNGRVVAFQAEYRHDWYDAEALAAALNEALRESGRGERFHPLVAEDQDLNLMLLAPGVAKIVREEFFVPLDKPLRAKGRRRS